MLNPWFGASIDGVETQVCTAHKAVPVWFEPRRVVCGRKAKHGGQAELVVCPSSSM